MIIHFEEVRKLCTEYFRENISDNIIGFEVSCYDLYDYQHYLYKKNYTLTNTVITKENVIAFIGDGWNCYEERWIYVESIGIFETEEKEEKRIREILAKTIPNYEDYNYGVLFGFVEKNF